MVSERVRRLWPVALALVGGLVLTELDGEQEIVARRRDFPPPLTEHSIREQRGSPATTRSGKQRSTNQVQVAASVNWRGGWEPTAPIFEVVFSSWPPG